MKKRILSFILSFVMILSLLPMQVLADEVQAGDEQSSALTATIIVRDGGGTPVTNAGVVVKRGESSYTVSTTATNGQYQFTKDAGAVAQSDVYEITVEKIGYESQTVTMHGTTNTIIVTLTAVETEQWQTFQVIDASGKALVKVDVDLVALKGKTSAVSYSENVDGNRWQFAPAPESNAAAFWTAVQACMDDDSRNVLVEAGLGEGFAITGLMEKSDGTYVAKASTTGLVELYDESGVFLGAGNSGIDTHYNAHALYAKYLGMTWDANAHAYIDNDGKVYDITIEETSVGSGCYKITNREEKTGMFVVTYTDGVDGIDIFPDQKHAVDASAAVPAYVGTPTREGYSFKNWALPDGTEHKGVVTEDITLHAVWEISARYTGTVRVYVDGSFALNGKVNGTKTAIETILGTGVKLYLSKEGQNFVEMTASSEETGVYSASLENGKYYIYSGVVVNDEVVSYTKLGDQILWMENADRTCYLFYNYTISYDCDGGSVSTKGTDFFERGLAGSEMKITSMVPTHPDDYKFVGWKDNATGKVYQPGEVLTARLDKNYTLTAQWTNSEAKCDFSFTISASRQVRNYVASVDVKVVRVSDGAEVFSAQEKSLGASVTASVSPGAYYDVRITGYHLKDGSLLNAENETYGANITVGGVAAPGAYIHAVYGQQEDVVATIVAVSKYTLVLYTENGLFANQSYEYWLENISRLPDLSDAEYIPVADGLEFAGWEWEMGTEVRPGEPLKEYSELVAVWKEPSSGPSEGENGSSGSAEPTVPAVPADKITIEGQITVDNGYSQVNEDKSISHHDINRADYVTSVSVLLQRAVGTIGYYETVDVQTLTWKKPEEGETEPTRLCGCVDGCEAEIPITVKEYSFANMPADGQYRVVALSPNYVSSYQVETDSINHAGDYTTYLLNNGDAVNLSSAYDNIATVNALMKFAPPSFDLEYKVDASGIGVSYRPAQVEILVTYDDGEAYRTDPTLWPVISQMLVEETPGGEKVEKGDVITLTNGIGTSSYPVWTGNSSGEALYDYAIRVGAVIDAEDEETTDEDAESGDGNNAGEGAESGGGAESGDETAPEAEKKPYYIEYTVPAHLDTLSDEGEQTQLLVAELVPKTYSITYELNGGSLAGQTYPTSHTWSKVTSFGVVPIRSGYKFEGWDVKIGNADRKNWTGNAISADITGDIVFYAKWSRIVVNLQVVMDHGNNTNRGTIKTQLTSRQENETNYQSVAGTGYAKEYEAALWNVGNAANGVDVVEIPYIYTELAGGYDYNVSATMSQYDIIDSCEVNGSNVEAGVSKDEVGQSGGDNSTAEVEYDVVACLRYDPDLLNLQFNVAIDNTVEAARRPRSVGVKVTYWDTKTEKWTPIDQHKDTVMEVSIGENGAGAAECEVKRWQDKTTPYYYRIAVVSLNLQNGKVVNLTETVGGERYFATGYDAVVSVTGVSDVPGAFGSNEGDREQVGTIHAVVDMGKVVFHANTKLFNENGHNWIGGTDEFRTYYPAAEAVENDGKYYMNADGSITPFYAIPEFEYLTHNEYIFRGWYDKAENSEGDSTESTTEGTTESAATAMVWSTQYLTNGAADVHLYANWIETGEVAQDPTDNKVTVDKRGFYKGFDLFGVQIRFAEGDSIPHHGTPGPGLRFLGSMSKYVHDELTALQADFEYGFILTLAATAKEYLGPDDWLLYTAENVNGIDTRITHGFVINQRCNGINEAGQTVVDHFNGDNYRLFTAVITYDGVTGAELDEAKQKDILARAYLRYVDANGLLRTYHNNYTGTRTNGGLSVSYATARDVITGV